MSTITPNSVTLSQTWGASFCDYTIGSKNVDFQDLMVAISEKRAVSVEGEINPLTTRIRQRNAELDILGSLLAIFTQTQAKFKSDDTGDARASVEGITEDMIKLASEAYRKKGGEPQSNLNWWNSNWTKSSVEGMVSILKSMIDSRNNEAQTDMSRLQSLVDRRDESYSTATNLMTAVSDTRSNLIRNL